MARSFPFSKVCFAEIIMEEIKKDLTWRIFIDVSGSTDSQSWYWRRVGELLEQLVEQHGAENIVCFLWDDKLSQVNLESARLRIRNMQGGKNTHPSVFASAQCMPVDCCALIISDGQIPKSEFAKCDGIVENRRFTSIRFYFLDTGGSMDLSVSMSFTRNCEDVHIFVEKGEEQRSLVQGANTTIQVDLDRFMNEPELFLAQYLRIRGTIILQNMGKSLNVNLRDALLALKKNLLRTIAIQASDGTDWHTLRKLLMSKDYWTAVQACREIIGKADSTIGKQVEEAIEDLIRQCSGSNDFSFENLAGRQRRAEVQTMPDMELPPQASVSEYECPITFNGANPCILIHEGAPILEGVDKNFIEYLMTNPLALLTNPELVQKLRARIGHPMGCDAFVELWKRGNMLSPFTRDPVSCALIPLVPDDPTERVQYAKANTFTLANLFFGNKLVGDAGLWYGVVYLALRQLPRFIEEKPLDAAFQQFLRKFWSVHMTNMTLSGLPIAPMIKCPADIAIWFCVISPDVMLYRGENHSAIQVEDDATNRLRSFGNTAEHLIQLLEMLDYCYDREWTFDRVRLYKAFEWMMLQSKDPNSNWRTRIRAQWQNHIVLPSGIVVLLDGPAEAPLPLPAELQGFSLGKILALMPLVDKSKKTNSIMIPRVLEPIQAPAAVTNYGYPDMPNDWIRASIPVCPETMRPYVIDKRDRKEWRLRSEMMYGSLDKQIHNYNYFIQFVFEKNKYPASIEEFILYTLAKQSNREVNPVDTLPKYQLTFVQGLFKDYEDVLGQGFADVPVAEFKRLAFASMREVDRCKLDGSDKLE